MENCSLVAVSSGSLQHLQRWLQAHTVISATDDVITRSRGRVEGGGGGRRPETRLSGRELWNGHNHFHCSYSNDMLLQLILGRPQKHVNLLSEWRNLWFFLVLVGYDKPNTPTIENTTWICWGDKMYLVHVVTYEDFKLYHRDFLQYSQNKWQDFQTIFKRETSTFRNSIKYFK